MGAHTSYNYPNTHNLANKSGGRGLEIWFKLENQIPNCGLFHAGVTRPDPPPADHEWEITMANAKFRVE